MTCTGSVVGAFLAARDNRWRQVGRVHFNLAENRTIGDNNQVRSWMDADWNGASIWTVRQPAER